MMKMLAAASAVSLTVALPCLQSKPAVADVVVNNILSPFSVTQIGPGHRVYSSGWPWYHHHSPNVYTRCHTRWDPYFSEWRRHCYSREYGENFRDDYRPYYRANYRGYYRSYYRNDYRSGFPY